MNYITAENYMKSPKYVAMPKVILTSSYYSERLKPIDKLVYTFLNQLARTAAYNNQVTEKGIAYVKIHLSTIAHSLTIGAGAVRSSIDRLIENDLLTEKKGKKIAPKEYEKTIYYVKYPLSEEEIEQIEVGEPEEKSI